jgi:hypothetical protein
MRLSVPVLGLCLALAATTLVAQEPEKKIPLKKLPAAVKKAVKKAFPDGKFVSASSEKEEGKLVYEIQLKVKKHNVDATFTAEGKLVSVEKEITTADLPKAVRDELDRRYPKATIKKVEDVHITEGDKKFFEALLVTKDKKTVEVKFAPDGKFLGEESKDTKKDEKDKKKE